MSINLARNFTHGGRGIRTRAPRKFRSSPLQFATLAGARVIANSSHDSSWPGESSWALDDLINYHSEPQWGERVRRMTGGAKWIT
jgi:hypothetical protein